MPLTRCPDCERDISMKSEAPTVAAASPVVSPVATPPKEIVKRGET
jgi:hypothetical protein